MNDVSFYLSNIYDDILMYYLQKYGYKEVQFTYFSFKFQK